MAQTQEKVTCPHGLEPLLADVFWCCDACGNEVAEGLEVFGCDICRLEICKACYTVHQAHQAQLLAPPRQELQERRIGCERRLDPDDGLLYTFEELLSLHAETFSREEIEEYWLETCEPLDEQCEPLDERCEPLDEQCEPLDEHCETLDEQFEPVDNSFGTGQGELFLGDWSDWASSGNPLCGHSPQLQPSPQLQDQPWASSEPSPALGPCEIMLPSPMPSPSLGPTSGPMGPVVSLSDYEYDEPVTPRECSVEGCDMFAGAAGLCSVCYRDAYGCTPPPAPPRKQYPRYDNESKPHSDEHPGTDAQSAAKKKKKKKKKKEGDDSEDRKEAPNNSRVVPDCRVEEKTCHTAGERQLPPPPMQPPPPTQSQAPRATTPEPAMKLAPPASPSNKKEPRKTQIRRWLDQVGLLDDDAVPHCGLVYDGNMCAHRGPSEHPEQPDRIVEIWKQLGEAGLVDACKKVRSRQVTKKELLYVHTEEHITKVLNFKSKDYSGDEGSAKGIAFPFGVDTYLCDKSAQSALVSAGSLLNLIDHSMKTDSELHCGMAIIRPPGHHASQDKVSGFCLFNNVAIAARHLQKVHGLRRVMIVDWDVHHGNGTNSIFANSQDVLFFSMHRYDTAGKFFPGTGKINDVGRDSGHGFSINVPLNKGYNDSDAKHVMRHVLRPLVEKFNPQAILVSAGFDAVSGDPLGGCFMTPQGFGWMTRYLYHFARKHCEGRLFLALEGGYNCEMIGRCVVECVNTLVLEAAGVAACEIPPMPASPHWSASSPPQSPMAQIMSSPKSPMMTSKKRHGGIPTEKTVQAVRKLTELHSKLRLKLPISPEVGEPLDPSDDIA